jgi:hypothetical protein
MITFVLLCTIDSSIKQIISAYTTGKAQWKALCDKYDKQNDTTLHALVNIHALPCGIETIFCRFCNFPSMLDDYQSKFLTTLLPL